MPIAGFPAGPFGTNCWILAPGARSEAIIVDPGMDSRRGIEQLVSEHGLRPVAVVLTHGHLDHMWSVLPVCDGYDIPAWVHPEDRHLLADPWAGVSGETRMMFASVVGATDFAEPSDVRTLDDGAQLEIAGMHLVADHATGHTPASPRPSMKRYTPSERSPVAAAVSALATDHQATKATALTRVPHRSAILPDTR